MSQFKSFSYDELLKYHGECVKQLGPLLSLPVIKSPFVRCQELYAKVTGCKVLDIGSGSEKFAQKILQIPDDLYYALDDDPSIPNIYRSITEIPSDQYFGLVTGNQVFEHIPIDESVALLRQVANHMLPSAYIILTVPNTAHPNRYLANPTHITPWSYSHLAAALRIAGLSWIEAARYNKHPYPTNLWDRLVTAAVCRVFRVDWCDSIMIVGQKIAKI